MHSTTTLPNKPTLYAGQDVPFDKLEPEPFADFVVGAMGSIGQRYGFEGLNVSRRGTDCGFDAFAHRSKDKALVCVQCKRWRQISIPEVAEEIAKVAIDSALKGERVVAHYIVASGELSQVLFNVLRKKALKYPELLNKAIELAGVHEKFKVRRKKLASRGADPREVIATYMKELDLQVWGGRQFDIELKKVWDQIQPLLDCFFTVHTVVIEHPRPQFDEPAWLKRCIHERPERTIDLHVSRIRAPSSERDLGEKAVDPSTDDGRVPALLNDAVLGLVPGSVAWLVGDGGSGKSTSLRLCRAVLAERRQRDPRAPLPLFLNLGAYSGELNDRLDGELGLSSGRWFALGGAFVLLLDGWDRVRRELRDAFVGQVREALQRQGVEVSVLISSRTGAVELAELGFPKQQWKLRGLDANAVLSLARLRLHDAEVTPFLGEWRRVAADMEWLRRPFGVQAALAAWQAPKLGSRREILESAFNGRLKQESGRDGHLDEALSGLPGLTLRALISGLAEELWLRGGRSDFTEDECWEALVGVPRALPAMAAVGGGQLTAVDAKRLLLHRGFLVQESSGEDKFYRFEHDEFAALFASNRLAQSWQSSLALLDERHADEAWVLAAPCVRPEELDAFLHAVFQRDAGAAVCPRGGSPRPVRAGHPGSRSRRAYTIGDYAGGRTASPFGYGGQRSVPEEPVRAG